MDTPTQASAASLAFAMALHDSADNNLSFTAPSALTLMDPSVASSATASASAAAAAALAAGQDPDEAALRAFADAMHGAAAAAAPPPPPNGGPGLVAVLDTAVRRVAAAAMEALRHADSAESLDLDPEIQRSKASSKKALAAVAVAVAAGGQQAQEEAGNGDEAGSEGEGREQGGGAKAHATVAPLQGPTGAVSLLPAASEPSLRIPLIHSRSSTALCTGGMGASAVLYGGLPLPPANGPGSGPATPPHIPRQRATYHGPQTLTLDVSQGPHAHAPPPAATPGYRLPSFRNRVVVAMSTDVAADSPKRLPGVASLGGAPSLGGGPSALVSFPSVASAAPNSQADSPTAAADMRRTFVRTTSSNFSRSCFGSEFTVASSGWRSSIMANGSPRASAGFKTDSASLPSCSGSRSLSQSHAQFATATRFRAHLDGTSASPGTSPRPGSNRASATGDQHPASEPTPRPSHKHTRSSGAALESHALLDVPIGPLGASFKSRSPASQGNSPLSTAPGVATSPPRPAVSPFLQQCNVGAASTPPAAARAEGSFRSGSGSPLAAANRSRSTSRERSPPVRDLKHVGDSGLLNALGCCDVPLVFRNAAGASTIGAPPGMELNGSSPRVSGSGSASEGEAREVPWEGPVEAAGGPGVQRVPSRAAYLPTLEEDVAEYDSGSPTGAAATAAVAVAVQRVGEQGEGAVAVGVALGPQLAVVHVAPLPDALSVEGAVAPGAGAGSYVVVHEFARPIQGVVMRLKQLRRLVKNRLHGKGKSNGGLSSKEPSTSGMAAGVGAAE